MGPDSVLRPVRSRVDIVIPFDTTGSMSDKRQQLAATMGDFAAALDSERLDWRLATVPFGDLEVVQNGVRERVVDDLPFHNTADGVRAQLAAMPAFWGGSNWGESAIEAMEASLAKPWRSDALRIVILLTDDSAHGEQRAETLQARLVAEDVLAFVAAPDTPYYRRWAEATGGIWWPISPHIQVNAVVELLRTLIHRVTVLAAAVHREALGSPQRYLELGRGGE